MAHETSTISRVPAGTDLVEWYTSRAAPMACPLYRPRQRRSPLWSRLWAATQSWWNAACLRAWGT